MPAIKERCSGISTVKSADKNSPRLSTVSAQYAAQSYVHDRFVCSCRYLLRVRPQTHDLDRYGADISWVDACEEVRQKQPKATR